MNTPRRPVAIPALPACPALAAVLLALSACGAEAPDEASAAEPGGTPAGAAPGKADRGDETAAPPTGRDVISTDLVLDLAARRGRATLTFGAGEAPIRLERGDLRIEAVFDAEGAALDFSVTDDGVLEIAGAGTERAGAVATIDYGFSKHGQFNGYDATPGLTFLWPYFCGNLFPCHSEPADGTTFTLEVAGVPEGLTAIYPKAIPAPAPAYQVALALGDYTYERLGKTEAGTEVGMYFQPGGRDTALRGAAGLPGYFGFFEALLGPYLFGPQVASVSVDWGPGDFGGMEHHPFWHIDDGQMDDPNTHAHEAAHGWFGDGVRIACWEDFVLSEGTVTYLAARAIEAVDGASAGEAAWRSYTDGLRDLVAGGQDTVAWLPESCNEIRIAEHPLWSLVPYYKGAFFLRAVEAKVGREALDGVLRAFYADHGGRSAARMQDLLDAIEARTGFDPADLAATWLLSTGLPRGL